MIGHGLRDADPRDAPDDVVQALDVLHVHRREHVDARDEQFLDVPPALGMAAARGIRVRELIDQQHRRAPLQGGIEVELLQHATAMLHALARQHLEPLEQCRRVASPVRLDHADHDI